MTILEIYYKLGKYIEQGHYDIQVGTEIDDNGEYKIFKEMQLSTNVCMYVNDNVCQYEQNGCRCGGCVLDKKRISILELY